MSCTMRVAVLVVSMVGVVSTARAESGASGPAPVSAAVANALSTTGLARVLITLRDPAPLTAAAHVREAVVSSVQDAVLVNVPAGELALTHRYRNVASVAAVITQRALDTLRADPDVLAVQTDEPSHAHLPVSVPALRANVVHAGLGVRGSGVNVVVLDSGVDVNDPELAIVAQQCFTHGACQPGSTNTGSNALDDQGHGTNVASIVASNGTVFAPGFAPSAGVVAVKVLDSQGRGFVSDFIAGLDWVRTHLATLNVRVVNMSLGTDTLYTGSCDAQQSLFSAVVAQFTALNIVVFASTGNAGSATSVAAPACLTGVVAVGATYKANVGRRPTSGTYKDLFGGGFPDCFDDPTSLQKITCFTNSNARTDIVAPGAPITTRALNGGLITFYGTSQASPTAAGIAALMLQVNGGLTPAQLASRLKLSGPKVTDAKNGLQFTEIDALSAVQLAAGVAPIVTVNGSTFSVGQTVNVTAGLINGGLAVAADIYVGLVRPDGSILFFTPAIVTGSVTNIGSFRPIATGVSLAAPFSVSVPNFYSHQWTATDPKGTYIFFVGAVTAGALSGGSLPPGAMLGLLGILFSLS